MTLLGDEGKNGTREVREVIFQEEDNLISHQWVSEVRL